MNQEVRPPRPYLTREETNEILAILGFPHEDDGSLIDNQVGREKMEALQTLISGAIAAWTGMEFAGEGQSDAFAPTAPEAINELQEWSEEWLVG